VELTPKAAVTEFRERIRWMNLVAVLVVCALVGRLFYEQVLRADHWSRIANDNVLRRIDLPTTRGIIRDARGRVIATNRPSYNVYIIPGFFRIENYPRLAEYLGLSRDERDRLEARMRSAEGPRAGCASVFQTTLEALFQCHALGPALRGGAAQMLARRIGRPPPGQGARHGITRCGRGDFRRRLAWAESGCHGVMPLCNTRCARGRFTSSSARCPPPPVRPPRGRTTRGTGPRAAPAGAGGSGSYYWNLTS
jgi:hypothetical protein